MSPRASDDASGGAHIRARRHVLFFAIVAGIGVVRRQPRRYWVYALAAVLCQGATFRLFAAYGTAENPSGDGIITRALRSQGDAWTMVGFPFAILLGWAVPIALVRRGYVPTLVPHTANTGAPRRLWRMGAGRERHARFMNWAARLHGGQLVMLAPAAALASCVIVVAAMLAEDAGSGARGTIYCAETRIEPQNVGYVCGSFGEHMAQRRLQEGATLSDVEREVADREVRNAHLVKALTRGTALACGAASVFPLALYAAALWSWFGARRRP